MRRLAAALLATVCAIAAPIPAHADMLLLGAGVKAAAGGGGGGYTGPADITGFTSPTFWIGMRAMSTAKATALVAAIRVCTAADALCTDIHVTAAGGLSAADITTSTCTTTCTVKTWYDQSGNGNDFTQGTPGSRATFTPSCIGSLPCATSNGTTTSYFIGTTTVTQPFTINAAAIRTGNTTTYSTILEPGSGAIYWVYKNVVSTLAAYAGGSEQTATASDNAWHGLTSVFNGASGVISVDGSQSTVNYGTSGFTSVIEIFDNTQSGGSSILVGKIEEIGLWPSAPSGANITSLNSNQHTYGIF